MEKMFSLINCLTSLNEIEQLIESIKIKDKTTDYIFRVNAANQKDLLIISHINRISMNHKMNSVMSQKKWK